MNVRIILRQGTLNMKILKHKYTQSKRKHIDYLIRRKGGDGYYYASCFNKLRQDKVQAKEKAQILGIKAYKCKYCAYWHTGH